MIPPPWSGYCGDHRAGTVFLSQNWNFTAPVFIDDTITAQAEVVGVHPSKPVCQLKINITRQTGELGLEGEAWCYQFTPQGKQLNP